MINLQGLVSDFRAAAHALTNHVRDTGMIGTVRKLDFTAKDGQVYTAIEQNKNLPNSQGAIAARGGSHVAQIKKLGEPGLLGRMVDNDFVSYDRNAVVNPIPIAQIRQEIAKTGK